MTQDEIIDMARFAGIRIDSFGFQGGFIEEFKAFAELVAAKEREACAKVCDEYSATGKIEEFDRGWLACAKNVAAVIRARGET